MAEQGSTGQETVETRPHFGEVMQVGVVVRDLDRAMAGLSDIFGMGPFRSITYPPEGRGDMNRIYRGEPGDFTYRQAFVDLGTVELEIIQPLSGRSVWSDFLEKHGEGIHHIRFNTFDMNEVVSYLAGQGIPVAMSGNGLRPGTCWANFDTEERVGFTIEVMQAVRGASGRTPAIVDGQVIAA